MLLPFVMRPTYGITIAMAAIAVFLAWQSPAFPVALAGLPSVAFAIIGPNPLPQGAVTGLLSMWTVLAIACALARGRGNPPGRVIFALPITVSLVLLGVMLARLGASNGSAYGTQKVELFFAGNMILMIAGVLIGWRHRRLTTLLKVMLAVAIASGLVLTVQLATGSAKTIYPGRFAITTEDSPIALGRSSAEGLLIAIYLLLSGGRTARLWAMAGLPLLAVALVGAGSRGPVVGLVCGLAALLALAASSPTTRRRLVFVLIAVVIVVAVVPALVPNSSITRSLSILTGDNNGLSSNGRSGLWSAAYSAFAARPLIGIGTGGFSVITSTGELYPHNLLLEMAVELGFVGLVLVLVFLADVAARLTRAWHWATEGDRPGVSIVIALFVASLVNALFSGGLPDNQSLWLWAGVGTGLAARLTAGRLGEIERGAVQAPQPPRGELRVVP